MTGNPSSFSLPGAMDSAMLGVSGLFDSLGLLDVFGRVDTFGASTDESQAARKISKQPASMIAQIRLWAIFLFFIKIPPLSLSINKAMKGGNYETLFFKKLYFIYFARNTLSATSIIVCFSKSAEMAKTI